MKSPMIPVLVPTPVTFQSFMNVQNWRNNLPCILIEDRPLELLLSDMP